MTRASRALIIGLALFAFVTSCAKGRTGPEDESGSSVVRIATSGDYPPFSHWPDDRDEPAGFEPDLLRRYFKTSDQRIEWVRFRWADLIADAQEDAFDLAAGGITVRPDRSRVGTFSVPVARTSAVVLVRSPSGLTLAELDQPGRRIAVNLGGHLERVARARFPMAELLPTTPNSAVPLRLASGEVEAIVTDSHESPLWRRDQPDWLQLGPLTRDEKAIFAAPGQEALLAGFDAWVLGDAGIRTLLDLREKHLGVDRHSHPLTVVTALLAAVDERLALMPDVARYKHANALPIEVHEREAHVLEAGWLAVQRAAEASGTPMPSKELVLDFYRALIEAAKEVQHRVIAEADFTSAAPVPDLDAEIRPALIRIGDRIARLIALLPGDRRDDLTLVVLDELPSHGLSETSLHAIRDAVAAIIHERNDRSIFAPLF